MPAARCSMCNFNAPIQPWAGLMCPICENERLEGFSNGQPDEDWESRKNHAIFDRYYARTRGDAAPASGDAPRA